MKVMLDDGGLKTVLSPNLTTITKFQNMRDMLMDFLSSSPNIERYLESVLEIKNQEIKDDRYLVN